MRWIVVVAGLASACGGDSREAPPAPAADAMVNPAPRDAAPLDAPQHPAWTFAVISDLHLPNPKTATVKATIAALIALHPRFVVITGDDTNGTGLDIPGAEAWRVVGALLAPLRTAGIPVLPIAGNHDSYTAAERAHYAATFGELAAWAAPLAIVSTGVRTAGAPFSYSVDVDGVHLTLAHIVAQGLSPEVARWLRDDLAAASHARLRIVFGHVPLASVIQPPNRAFVAQLGALLEAGHVELMIAGHEHLVWDEDVALPAGGTLRELLVGCTSGFYNYGPSKDSMRRAGCVPIVLAGTREPLRCKMPNGGGEFVLGRGRKNRQLQHAKNTFTLVTIDGSTVSAKPMTLDGDGKPEPFYLNER